MCRRCEDHKHWNFKYYGEKGVFVCEEWRSDPWVFLDWLDDNEWRKGLSVDRIDDAGPYAPENCRIVNQTKQQRSKSISIRLTANGQTKTVAEWSEVTGIPYDTLKRRVRTLGWPDERAVNTAVGQ